MQGLQAAAEGVRIAVRVQPNARRTALAGRHDGALKVAVAAPPIEGKANALLLAFLAGLLGVPGSRLSLVRGEKSRSKTVLVAGSALEEVAARIEAAEAESGGKAKN